MKRRASLITAAGVVAALAAAPSAQAAIAGGLPLKTENRPDLVSASIRTTTDSTWPKEVRYCFDETLVSGSIVLQQKGSFRLEGYDATSKVAAEKAVLDLDNTKCVIASFPDNTNLANYTVATVLNGSVKAASSNLVNLTNAVGLADSVQRVGGGLTTAPDLLGAQIDPSFNRIVLTMDNRVADPEAKAEDRLRRGRILYYDPAGNEVYATSWEVSKANRSIVYATFPADGNRSVRQAVRVALEDHAFRAENDLNEESVRQSIAVTGQDGYTSRPDLLAVTPVPGRSAVDFAFDHAVAVGDVKKFQVFRNEETRYNAQSATVLQDDAHAGRVVRAFFQPEAMAMLAELAVASVDNGAAVSTGGPGYLNTIGSKLLGASRAVKGFTSAPDVSAVSFDYDDGTATLEVDQMAWAVPWKEEGSRFHVVDRAGNQHPFSPTDVVVDKGHKIVLHIGAGMAQQAVGVVLDQGALATWWPLWTGTPEDNDLSVRQAIGRAEPVPAAPGTGPFDPPVAPGSPATPAPKPAAPAGQVLGQGGKLTLVVTGRLLRGKRGATGVRLRVRANSTTVKRARVRIRMFNVNRKQIGSRIVSVRIGKVLTVRQGVPKRTRSIKLAVL